MRAAPRPRRSDGPQGGYELRLTASLLLWAAVCAAVTWMSAKPRLLAADAGELAFSEARARTLLERLVGDGTPHPAGSPANERVREQILSELRRAGFSARVEQHFVQGPYGVAGTVSNIVARVQGTQPELPAALFMAHYDSVGAGPGAGDDLAGVAAVLEATRARRAAGRPARTWILLFTEGEEEGLLGAEGFCQQDPTFAEVGLVVDFEGRGASGPSRLFQTGPGSGALVRGFLAESRYPSANSLSSEVYRRMPNDTDFSSFRDRGLPGLDFAFSGDWAAYHTPLDTPERLDPVSLAHHGENAIAALRAVERSDVLGGEQPVYFDVFGRHALAYSARAAQALGLLAVLGILVGYLRARRAGALSATQAAWGLLAVPGVLLGAFGLGLLFRGLARLVTDQARPFWARFLPGQALILGLGLAALALTAAALRRRAQPAGLAHGVWLAWALLALLSSLFVPGASYPFLVPALVLAVYSSSMRYEGDLPARYGNVAAWALPAAALVWMPVQLGLADAFGLSAVPVVILPLVFSGTLLLPNLAAVGPLPRRALSGTGLALALFGLFVMTLIAPLTEERPGHLNLDYCLDRSSLGAAPEGEGDPAAPAPDGGTRSGSAGPASAFVLARSPGVPLPPTYRQECGFEGRSPARSSASVAALEAPSFELESVQRLESAAWLVRGRLRSPRGASRIGFPILGVDEVRVDGLALMTRSGQVSLVGMPAEGHELELVLPAGREHWQLVLEDVSFGLPREARHYAESRPAELVPYGPGDRTRVRSSQRLSAPSEAAPSPFEPTR